MKVHAHVGLNGNLVGLVASPEGEPSPMLTPSPGVQVCEIQGHGIKGDTMELDQLVKLLEANTVTLTPTQGKLVRRKK
jgi:hypothetical protein